jgi:exodeoxyribonuclease III
LKAAGVDRDVRGEPEASDHAPSWIELKSPGRGGLARKAPAKPARPPKSALGSSGANSAAARSISRYGSIRAS